MNRIEFLKVILGGVLGLAALPIKSHPLLSPKRRIMYFNGEQQWVEREFDTPSELLDDEAITLCPSINGNAVCLKIQGSKDLLLWDGANLFIGCLTHDLDHWLANYQTIGEENGYSSEQIEEYGTYMQLVDKIK